jgi:hypothetical protein
LIKRYRHEWKKDLIQKRDAKTCMEKHQRRQGACMLGNRRKLSPSTTVPPFSLHRISLLKNIAATQMRWETYS